MPRTSRRNLMFIVLPLGGVAFLVAAVYLLDWYVAMPMGRTPSYVGRQKCAECHQKEVDLWHGSDHDLAMDHATPQTVLGDFDNSEFTHIAFDDLLRLPDAELAEVVHSVVRDVWTVALADSSSELRHRVLRTFNDLDRSEVLAGLSWLEGKSESAPPYDSANSAAEPAPGPVAFLATGHKVVRPCDIADAQQAIGDAARTLARQGRITAGFAVTSKMTREGDRFYVTTDNRSGEMEKFPVKYVFGVRPLQQYLVEFPDGRIQCLPITWNTERRQWYHLYPKERINHNDPHHWTR